MPRTNVRLDGNPALFRSMLRGLGTLAVFAGSRGVLLGAREVPHPGAITASLDSEYRFYASWYPIVGLAVLDAARQPSVDRRFMRLIAAGVGLAAAGRILSLRTVGRPARSQLALLAAEVGVATVILPWHRRAFPGGA
jgi:hypothetical protein